MSSIYVGKPQGGESVPVGKGGWRAQVEFWRGEKEGVVLEVGGGSSSSGVEEESEA